MNFFKKIWCRTYQFVLKSVSPLLNWRQPMIFDGENALDNLCVTLKENLNLKILVVTDKGLVKAKIVEKVCNHFDKNDVQYVIFDQTVANPTLQNVKDATKQYNETNCNTIVAIGGGSAMDCAKGVGISVVYPNKSLEKFKGILKVHKKIPTLVAIPTTAGTGSECTVATVLTNEKTHQKYAINDLHLIPRYAVLAPELTQGLPAFLTATTGMDALTHAIEAFIGRGNTKQTTAWAKEAVQLVFENIKIACQNGSDLVARAKMQRASYLAGLAFTRAYVGYVHAVAHSLGGRYNVAHGLANAVILPYVLERYSTSAYDKLSTLADCCKMCPNGTTKEKATAFIEEIKQLNKELGIGTKFDFIQKEDIPYLAILADKEANPLYPVPKLMDKKELEKIYFDLIP